MQVFAFIVIFVLAWLISALSTMLSINVVHTQYWDFIPTISYSTAMAITFFPLIFATFWAAVSSALKSL